MGVFVEFVANIGLAAVKDKLNDAVAEKCARDRLLSYLTQQNSLNFSVSLDEEIDFGGLAEYITEELIDDVKKRFWGNRKERGQAREQILQKACSYASANTSLSRERTIKIVGTSVDVLRKFYRNKTNRDLVLTEEVRERICELEDVTYGLAYSAEATFSVFDTELKLPIIREIECARVENLVRTKEKVSILDIGDEIKIVYIPGNSQPKGKYVDRIETSGVEAGMLFSRASSEIDSSS